MERTSNAQATFDESTPTRVATSLSTKIAFAMLVVAIFALSFVAFRLEQSRRATTASLRTAREQTIHLRRDLRAVETRARAAESHANALVAERDSVAVERDGLRSNVTDLTTRVEQAEAQQKAISDRLRESIAADVGELETTDEGRSQRVTLKLVDQVLFKSGEAELTPRGITVLDRVAEALRQFPDQQIWVQGYTDDAPIRDTARFASNWELSTARAASVVHYLQDHASIAPRRLAIVGFGEHRPISRRHASRNRRIEIVLFPEDVRVVRD